MQDVIYRFKFSDGSNAMVALSTPTPPVSELPAWTRLADHQCSNCPLKVEQSPHCPMAVRLVPLMHISSRRSSYDIVDVEVESSQRHYRKTTSIQNAMGSLMGLLAASSDCPHVAFLRGMAQFHLPFSNEKETLYRVASTYLLAQYLLQQKGANPDWELKNLRQHYDELQTVNLAMAARLRAASEKDGAINALVVLDSLAKTLQFSIDDALEAIRPVFDYYWREQQ
jgi:hypothetical protein